MTYTEVFSKLCECLDYIADQERRVAAQSKRISDLEDAVTGLARIAQAHQEMLD